PRSTSLCLMCDCPACNPSPPSKLIVIVGPRLEIVSQANQPPTTKVTSGISHMNDSRPRLATLARGGARGSVVMDIVVRRPAVLECGLDPEERSWRAGP